MRPAEFKTLVQNYPSTGRFLLGRLRHAMSEREQRLLEDAVGEIIEIDSATRILKRGQVYDVSTMLVEGFMLRTLDDDDKTYGVSFHVPGDFVDLHCFPLKRLDHNIETVGPAKIACVPHATLEHIMQTEPHLARMLWFSTLLDAAMHREWIMKLEQLTVTRRIAHIFAEIWHRLRMVGLGFEDGFETPLTQAHLGQMCGSSAIHANRAVKELREKGIAHFNRGRVVIEDRARLEEFGRFEHDYLYGEGILELDKAYG